MRAQEGTTSDKCGSSEVGGSIIPLDNQLQVRFDSNGLHFVVDGSPSALAKFLKVYERLAAEQETK